MSPLGVALCFAAVVEYKEVREEKRERRVRGVDGRKEGEGGARGRPAAS